MALLAELTMAVHFVVLAYIVFGAYLAWWRPKLIFVHLPFALWGLGIATLDLFCPLTWLEDRLRSRDEGPGFIERYVDGVLYPEEHLTLSRIAAATVVLAGYAGTLVVWRRRRVRA
jgi:hypothetical protein